MTGRRLPMQPRYSRATGAFFLKMPTAARSLCTGCFRGDHSGGHWPGIQPGWQPPAGLVRRTVLYPGRPGDRSYLYAVKGGNAPDGADAVCDPMFRTVNPAAPSMENLGVDHRHGYLDPVSYTHLTLPTNRE